MSRYFDRFPVIDYDGVIAKNILSRVDFTDQTKKEIYSTFQFTLEEGFERPDILSYNYYGSSQFDWMIYLTNNIVDPYYDYYRPAEDFKKYIDSKYGSVTNARVKTLFYRNNWHMDERLITIAEYESLTTNVKKYWKPKLANTGAIIGYVRMQEDWVVSTNKIIQLSLSSSVAAFVTGDRIIQTSTGAYAEIAFVDAENSILTVQHVYGEFVVNEEDGVTEVVLLQQNIPDEEASYWYPVNRYSQEQEDNELKRNVTVLKSSYLAEVEKQFIQQIST